LNFGPGSSSGEAARPPGLSAQLNGNPGEIGSSAEKINAPKGPRTARHRRIEFFPDAELVIVIRIERREEIDPILFVFNPVRGQAIQKVALNGIARHKSFLRQGTSNFGLLRIALPCAVSRELSTPTGK